MKTIDYSEVPNENILDLSADWEPPIHKFFGKKLANGKMEKEPVYVHSEYPRYVYSEKNGRVVARIVNSDQEILALGGQWEKTPAAFGVITAPSFDQIQKMKNEQEALEVNIAARTDLEDFKIPKMTKSALKALEA